MIQRRQDLGLALESRQTLGIARHRLGQHLDRHLPPELGVLGTVDLTHAALTELGGDLEMGKRCANHEVHVVYVIRIAVGEGRHRGRPLRPQTASTEAGHYESEGDDVSF